MTTRNYRIKNARASTCGIIGGCKYIPSILTISEFADVGTAYWTAPPFVHSVNYLVVGGGGGGGSAFDNAGSGGGGGGAVLEGSIGVVPGTSYTVVVGSGGNGGTITLTPTRTDSSGQTGQNSSFHTLIAYGGTGGYSSRTNNGVRARGGYAATESSGGTGGSGGGGGWSGGGGGGSLTNGSNGASGTANGAGGSGTLSAIKNVTYGAGGAGGIAASGSSGTAGQPNTGNGGGGAGSPSSNAIVGSNGGSGIVVLKYYV